MKAVKQNIFLLLAIGLFNISCAQQVIAPEKPMASVEIAAMYNPTTIIGAAQKMPEEFYSFRPTPEMRSFGELMIHIASSNYIMIAIAKGEEAPVHNIGPSKKEIIEALKKSFDYAAEARKTITPERKEIKVSFMGGSQPAGNVLDFNVFHSLSHYGNVVVYMRLKGLVPPSSE